MKKTIYLKSIFLLLCTLLAGVVTAQAEDYDYEWVKVTDLSEVETDDIVLLVDVDKGIALSSENDFVGISVTINKDGTISDDVPNENIKWKLTKSKDEMNNTVFSFTRTQYTGPLYGYTTGELSFDANLNSVGEHTSQFRFDNYGEKGGNLGFMFNSFFGWEYNDGIYRGKIKESAADITLYKRAIKNYVKWKRVNGMDIALENGDVVVIVDLATERAMSNDKADKDPDAVSVTLNDDKDRIIMDEVPEKVQWTFTNEGKYKFAVGDENLYADSDGLKVGTQTTNNGFDFSNNENGPYMGITIDGTQYYAGVDASMFSNTWKLVDGNDDIAKNSQVAIFKKFEDTQRIVKIELPEYYNYDLKDKDLYTLDERDFNEKVTITGAEKSEIKWKSSNPDVAEINPQGAITLKKRGTTVITAYVEATDIHGHDKASAKCTVIVDNSETADLGTKNHPLTVAEAKELAETGEIKIDNDIVVLEWEEGVHYYIKGKVSKVNSGMMAMFGDMDFGEMMGDSGSGMNFEDSMDDMDFDSEDMEESGFDMSSMGFDMSSLGFDMSAMFGTSDKVTYYISDDGTKDGQMKVNNGCGTLSEESTGGTMVFNPIPKLSAGDCVVVCGPLVYTEDTNMFSSMMGGNNNDEPKMSGKVDEMNYLAVYDPTLLVENHEIYVDKSLKLVDGGYTNYTLEKGIYSIDNLFDKFDGYNDEVKITDLSQIKEATFKSSDEEIVKWDDEKKELVGVNEGKAKITVKVKVVLQEADDNADPKVKEKFYTMKRKFKITVKTRDLDPAGYYDGDYVLTTSTDDLKDGTRLILAGTRVKDDKETDYIMVENNAMMGGGKNGSKYDFEEGDVTKEKIPCEKRPKGTLEIVLEKVENEAGKWYLNVGENENGEKLYLYASDSSEVEEEEGEDEGEGGNQFDFNKIMEMFSSSSGLKVGTKAEAISEEGVDSCMAAITFNGDIATIKFINVVGTNKAGQTVDKNNTIMLSSSFDMEEMMGMFGGMGGNKNEEENPDEPTGDEPTEEKSTFDMGSFDMFMASFNTKKPGDEQPTVDENGETKDPKCFMPRIYRFVPDPSFDINIDSDAEWKTIVTYKDVAIPNDVDAYEVVRVVQGEGENVSKAILRNIEYRKLKGGEPYLLHSTSPADSYTLTLLTDEESEELSDMLTSKESDESYQKNILLVSTRKTAGEKGNTSVYVLADKSNGVGFYKWAGGELGKGRVYLPVNASVAGANEFYSFFEYDNQPDALKEIDLSELNDAPYYDLQGRRVKTLTKGIYIVNGHKVIIK